MPASKHIHGPGAKEMVSSSSDPRVILGSCKCWEIDDLNEETSKLRDEVTDIREAMQNPSSGGLLLTICAGIFKLLGNEEIPRPKQGHHRSMFL